MSPLFGPGVIGQEAYDKAVAEEERTGGGIFGPAVLGPGIDPDTKKLRHDNPGPAVRLGESHPDAIQLPENLQSLSVKDLKEFLEKDSGLAAQLFAAEKARPDGSRISAIRALQFAEAKNEQPDEELLAEMKALIEAHG